METIEMLKAVLVVSGALVIALLSGCGVAGYELGAKVGAYRVDAQANNSQTFREQTGAPWYCDFITCKGETHGS